MFDDWQSHMNTAEYHLNEKLYKGARDDCTKALAVAENDKQRAESYYQRGFAYIGLIFEENNQENAIADWKKAADYGHNDAVRVLKEVVDINYTPQRRSGSSSSSGSSSAKPPPIPPNFTGRGRFTDEHGSIYEGDIVNGKKHGKGKQVFQDGDVYEGDYAKGTFNGKGRMIMTDGTVIEGKWKDGMFK